MLTKHVRYRVRALATKVIVMIGCLLCQSSSLPCHLMVYGSGQIIVIIISVPRLIINKDFGRQDDNKLCMTFEDSPGSVSYPYLADNSSIAMDITKYHQLRELNVGRKNVT